MFKRKSLVIDTELKFCSCCDNNDCLHYQAFVQCSHMKCLEVCQSKKLDEIIYYLVNPTNIFISAFNTLHNYTSKSALGCIVLVFLNVNNNLIYQLSFL